MFRRLPGGVFTDQAGRKSYYESRGADIPREVLTGDADVGFCGSDVFNEGLLGGEYRPLGFTALADAGCELVLATKEDQDPAEPLQIATSYPLSALYYGNKLGLDIAQVNSFGGRIEGKVRSGKYNAVVDITETGETLRANGLSIVKSLGEVSMGIVFRKEDYNPDDYTFDEWRLRAITQTITSRWLDVMRGKKPDQNRKNTSLLLADENKLVKAIGEEAAELIRATIIGEDVAEETADTIYNSFIANIRSRSSPLKAFNVLGQRNSKPTLRLE